MVKVGDKIRILKDHANGANVQKGDEFIVATLEGGGSVTVEGPMNWMFNKSSYIVISQPVYTIPADTETVTLKYADGSTQDIDVKDRARGIPEWVKDGAWVVDREAGCIMCLTFSRDDIQAHDIYGRYKVYYPRDSKVMNAVFRPFTNSDWKWGMWAEYRGEKVFVCSHARGGIAAASRTNSLFFIPFSEITPTTAP